ncbi:MAG: PAS domain S-box protein [Anaerolineaceae bacterium]|nr:PAS domain S-box protein [Anaerolineaceae bacterium]MBN2677026.1 PAS domain S-box protein [Anaerolineaceae bacterium]
MAKINFRRIAGISNVLSSTRLDRILLSFYRTAKPDYCFIGVQLNEAENHLYTLSLLEHGKRIQNIYYPLNDAFRAIIKHKKPRFYKKNVQRYYPADIYLQHWGIKGFIGYPILDNEKKPLGIIAAFYQKPIMDHQALISQIEKRQAVIIKELEKTYQSSYLGYREKRFEYLLRNSRDIILIIDKMGKVLYRAPSNYTVLGISDKDALGVNIMRIIHPDDLPEVQKMLIAVRRKPGLTADFQVRARHVNGEYKWIEGVVTNHTEEPSIKGLIVNYHDITEKKTADEEIASNERRFRTLIDKSHDCIALIDAKNQFQYFSPSVTKILGYQVKELLETDPITLVHPEDLVEMQRAGEELYRAPNKAIDFQVRIKSKDGNWKWIEAIGTNLLDNLDIKAVVINFKDISVRKYTEDKLRVTERSFKEFLESVNLAAIILDPDGRVEFINDYLLKLVNLSRIEVVGDSFFTRFLKHDDPFITAFHQGILNGDIPHQFEASLLTNSGEEKSIVWNSTVLRSVSGEVAGIACIGEDVTAIRKNEERAQIQIERVSALHSIDVVISSSFDSRIVFSVIVDQIMKQMGVDAVRILLFNPLDKRLSCVAEQGFQHPEQKPTEFSLSESHSAKAILERQTISFSNSENAEPIDGNIFEMEGFISGYSTPMIIKGQVKGVVEVYNRALLEPDAGWMEFFETLAGQAAIAIENDEMFDRLERALADLTAAYDSTLEGWVKALDLRDKETIGHTQRVAMMVVRFALELGVSGDDLVNIRRGALLHDIGKMGIPDGILNKAGPLTDDERLIIQRHPQYAYELLQPIQYLRPALDIPYGHHERWDGTGYPRGLKGEEIPLAARIFSVVDVWDALGSTRPYREKWDQDKMVSYLKEQSGKRFDPSIVKVFIDLVERKLI